MIFEKMSKRDIKQEIIVHSVVALIWIIACILGIILRDQVSWVVAVIAVGYLAVDELANVFFFWRKYGRVSEVQEKVDKTATKEE